MNSLKGTPMTKKEVELLIDLISSKPILTSKNTKATVNRLKRRAWDEIEVEFNAKNEQVRPRHQLTLRWVNLKKTCRKKFKACGGKLDLADREDCVVERVISLLDGSNSNVKAIETGCDEMSDSGSFDGNDITGMSDSYTTDSEVRKLAPNLDRFDSHRRQGVKFKQNERDQNLAMVEYYEKKTRKVEIEIKLLQLEILEKRNKVIA